MMSKHSNRAIRFESMTQFRDEEVWYTSRDSIEKQLLICCP
jgi:hypothetical protein